MDLKLLERAEQWRQQGRRSIRYEIGTVTDRDAEQLFVWDHDLLHGKIISSNEEFDTLDLAAEKKAKVLRDLESLQGEK